MNPIQKLHSLKQSLWYDNIQRKLLENGELKAMIERGEIRGVTSNPSIFQNAIAKSSDYDSALAALAREGMNAENIFWRLAMDDIQEACDLFRPLYDSTRGGDGYVSLEVSPFLANDAEGTARQAKELWDNVGRPNLMIKIPATKACLPAIRQTIAAGVNVNVTLIFSLERYAEVMEAYLGGIEDRVAAGFPVNRVASVASFFISRVDSKIDPLLPKDSPLLGKAAIANARLAFDTFESFFASSRFESLRVKHGARAQRPLWASTSAKNPVYPDTIYIDNLIGPDTVNTVPPATLNAFRDHGVASVTIMRGLDAARLHFTDLEKHDIYMEDITAELEEEGVKAFADAFTGLLNAIEEKRKNAASSSDPLADSVSKRFATLEKNSVPARLWNHDPTLWASDPEGQAEAKIRLGWLDSIDDARKRLDDYVSFAREIHDAGIGRAVVLGMGGSSLTAEVFSSLLSRANVTAPVSLAILDSTDPQQVAEAATNFPPDLSLYIVASKSGGTAEVSAAFDYFWKLSKGDGSRFIAITDPNTSLEALAKERGFRKIFNADPNVGGRYSALTDFGLVPAALMGMDLNRLLDHAEQMKRQCARDVPAAQNPGMQLGARIAESVLASRDKLTVVCDAPLFAMGGWIEQIIAESSGKNGKGMLPVAFEPLDSPEVYGADRLFVYYRQTGELDKGVAALKYAGHPVIELNMMGPYDAGAEFYRWEIAVATACHILGVNAFDQPDVQDSKTRTKAKIANFQKTGKLAEADLVEFKNAKPALEKFLAQAKEGSYVAINAYLPRNEETPHYLQMLRVAIREKTKCAVTAGFGPRFQHSTGQFHKGGPNKGLFIQVVYDAKKDMEIPNEGLSFGTLIRAQALGDYEALKAAGRKTLRIHLSKLSDAARLFELMKR